MSNLNKLINFVEGLERQHRHTLSFELDFQELLGKYTFTPLNHEVTTALENFKLRVLTDLAKNFLKASLGNGGLDANALTKEVYKKFRNRDIDFNHYVTELTAKIEALKPQKDELSLKHIRTQARNLLQWRYFQKGESPRKKNILKLHAYIYSITYRYRSIHNFQEYLQALDKLSKIAIHEIAPSKAQSIIKISTNTPDDQFFGKWHGFGIFQAKFHKNGNIYVKFRTSDQAQKVEKLLMVKN